MQKEASPKKKVLGIHRLLGSKHLKEKLKVSASANSIQEKHEESINYLKRRLSQKSSNSRARLEARLKARNQAKSANALQNCKVFASVRKGARNRIIDVMELECVPMGSVICREGDQADKLYLIVSGSCVVTKKSFGDEILAVMRNRRGAALSDFNAKRPVRTATVTAQASA